MARVEFDGLDLAPVQPGRSAAETYFRLGIMYSTGASVAQDRVAAHKWFNLAATNGSDEAKEYRSDLAGEMSSAEIAEALKLAREFMKLH